MPHDALLTSLACAHMQWKLKCNTCVQRKQSCRSRPTALPVPPHSTTPPPPPQLSQTRERACHWQTIQRKFHNICLLSHNGARCGARTGADDEAGAKVRERERWRVLPKEEKGGGGGRGGEGWQRKERQVGSRAFGSRPDRVLTAVPDVDARRGKKWGAFARRKWSWPVRWRGRGCAAAWPVFRRLSRGAHGSTTGSEWGGVVAGLHRWHLCVFVCVWVCYDRVGWCPGHMGSSNWPPYWPVCSAGGRAVSQLDLSDGIASTSLITPRTTSAALPVCFHLAAPSTRLRHL